MTSTEFVEEMVYYDIKPWGDEWERTSLQASLFYNSNRSKNAKAVEYDEFIPKKKEVKKQSVAEMMFRINTFMRAKQANGRQKHRHR